MRKYTAIIEVDVDDLMATNGEVDRTEEELEQSDDIEGVIRREFGWITQSGIHLIELTEIT